MYNYDKTHSNCAWVGVRFTYEVLCNDGAYVGKSGMADVVTELLQEYSLAQVILTTEGIVNTPK